MVTADSLLEGHSVHGYCTIGTICEELYFGVCYSAVAVVIDGFAASRVMHFQGKFMSPLLWGGFVGIFSG